MEKTYSVPHTVTRKSIIFDIATFLKYRIEGIFTPNEILNTDLSKRSQSEEHFLIVVDSILTDEVCQKYTQRDYDLNIESAQFDSGQVSMVDSVKREMEEQNVLSTLLDLNLITQEIHDREHTVIQNRIDGEGDDEGEFDDYEEDEEDED